MTGCGGCWHVSWDRKTTPWGMERPEETEVSSQYYCTKVKLLFFNLHV